MGDLSYLDKLDQAVAKSAAEAEVKPEGALASDGPTTPEASPEQNITGLGDAFLDTGKAALGAVESAGRGLIQTGVAAANVGLNLTAGPFMGDKTPQIPDPYAGVEKLIPEPKAAINKLTKDVLDLGIGLSISHSLGVGAKTGNAMIKAIQEQFAGSMLVREPHQERVSDFIEQHPSISNPFTRWMASDPNDTILAGKFKHSLEDALGVAGGSIAFKGLMLAYRGGEKIIEKVFGKNAEQVAKELEQEIVALNEKPPTMDERHQDKLQKTLALDPKNKTEVLTMPNEVESFETVQMNKLITREKDHAGAVDPNKVQGIRQTLQDPAKTSKMPPITVEEDAAGNRFLVDGRHRTQAAQEEGFTDITAKVVRSKDTLKLKEMQEQAGGAKNLEKVAAKEQEKRGAFQPIPEEVAAFQERMKEFGELGFDEQLPFMKEMVNKSINYSKIQSSEDVYYTLQQMAEISTPTVRTNGVKEYQSFQDIAAASNLFGAKPEMVISSLRSWGVDAAKIPAMLRTARVWQASLADDIVRDARAVGEGVGGDLTTVQALAKIQTLHELTALVSTIKTSTARTLNSLKMVVKPRYSQEELAGIIEATGGNERVRMLLDKLAMTQGDPNKVAKLLRVSWMNKVWDTHNELWINALLSGLSTHVINVSTATTQLMMKPAMRTLGGAIKGDWEQVADSVATFKALGSNIRDAWSMANKAFATERPILSITDRQLEINPTVSAQTYGLDPEKWFGTGVNWLGKTARITSRFLGAEDEFFKQLSYRAHLQMQVEKKALDLMKSGKISRDKMVERFVDGKMKKVSEYDAYVTEEFNKGFEYDVLPTGEMGTVQGRGVNKEALQYSAETTFTQSLKTPTHVGTRSFAEMLYQNANSNPVLRGTVLPFIKVPANLFREGVAYTPGLNLLQKKFQEDLVAGGARGAEAAGKLATSSFFMVSGIWLAMNGRITGAAPTDPDIRGRMYEKGWQPYSFVIGEGENKIYIPFNRVDPYGIAFGLMADVAQTYQHTDESDRYSFGAAATMAVANLLNSKGYLKGITDTMDILTGGQGPGALHKAELVLRGYATGHMPNILKIGELNPEMKDIRTVADGFLARTPFFSDKVEAKRGYFGDKIMAPVGWPWNALSPIKPTEETSDPALLELARLADGPAATRFGVPAYKIGNIDLHDWKNEEGQTAYQRMMIILNESDFHDRMNDLVTSESYLAGTDGDGFHRIGSKVVKAKELEKKYHEKALNQMLNEFQDLKEKVREWEREDRRMKRGSQPSPVDQLLEVNQ